MYFFHNRHKNETEAKHRITRPKKRAYENKTNGLLLGEGQVESLSVLSLKLKLVMRSHFSVERTL